MAAERALPQRRGFCVYEHGAAPGNRVAGVMPPGRLSLYKEQYCEEMVAFCKKGYSLTAYAAHLGVGRSTLNEWGKYHDAFADAIQRAKAQRALWYEECARGRAMGTNKDGSDKIITLGLINAGPDDWTDKQSLDHTSSDGSLTPQAVTFKVVRPPEADDT